MNRFAFLPSCLLLAVLLAGCWLPATVQAEETQALPVMTQLPEFFLIDHEGKPFTRRNLAGSAWIFDFIFTRCSGPCPVMTSKLGGLQRKLTSVSGLRLASVSVDPEHDTPAVLASYGREAGADLTRWTFLTGSKEGIFKLSRKGFLLGVEEDKTGGADSAVPTTLHSTTFTLVDAQGRIRGYYDSLDLEALVRLAADARSLAADPAR
jgi:protein SCO1/2